MSEAEAHLDIDFSSEGLWSAAAEASPWPLAVSFAARDNRVGFGSGEREAQRIEAFINELNAEYEECSEPGWDGYDAPPVSLKSLRFATIFFLTYLARDVIYPEVTSGPNGQLALEWNGDNGASFITSFSERGSILFAFISDGEKFNGYWKDNDVDIQMFRHLVEKITMSTIG